MRININSIQATKALRQAGFCLLLALYSLAAFKVDSFHELLHAQELKELHSAEQERNPCHKSIYHQEVDRGCEHKSHFTENTNCKFCEFNVSFDQLATKNIPVKKFFSISPLPFFLQYDVISVAQFSHADRGPPAIV